MHYQHQNIAGELLNLATGKVVCVGLNYHDHVSEMGSKINDQAVLFIKPSTAVCSLTQPIAIPQNQGECHNEAEVSVLIKQPLTKATPAQAMQAVWGYGIALDLTLREVQAQLKALGRPWERAKGFDGAAPLSPFIEQSAVGDEQNIAFSLTVNGDLRQQGNTELMIRPIAQLLAEISQHFTLLPGDVVLTGTPAGVGALHAGDKLCLTLAEQQFVTEVRHD